jgi:hypothetical protein
VARVSPGGVGDGLPQTPSGEPLLHRWFVLAMIGLSVVALALSVLVFTSRTAPPDVELPPAARRTPGSPTVTHERGQIVLSETQDVEDGVACAPNVRLVGDEGGRATARRALGALCQQLSRGGEAFEPVAAGLDQLDRERGIIRVALGAATGVDSSARVEDGTLVVELAPKFQFDNATEAAPFLAHELAHIGGERWPGAAPDVADELAALEAQAVSCELLRLGDDAPRGCGDAAAVLDSPTAEDDLREAGYPG